MNSVENIYYTKSIQSPVGELTLVSSSCTIKALLWEKEMPGRVKFNQRLLQVNSHPILDLAQEQLMEYFSGQRKNFDLPLEPEGTDFQIQVWKQLTRIPYGTTWSYQEQASQLGCIRKARAVGAANGRNPISIIVPCHRVIGKNGNLTGFAGGLKIKKYLLEFESGMNDKAKLILR